MARRRRSVRFAVAVAVVAVLVGGVAWARPTASVWWTAHRYLRAVVDRDCSTAGSVSVYVPPAGVDCSAASLGFPVELTAYRLSVSRVGWSDQQTSAGVEVPGASTGYSLHLTRHPAGWRVDAVDVTG